MYGIYNATLKNILSYDMVEKYFLGRQFSQYLGEKKNETIEI